jgi:ankyrin repeat protein
LWRETDEIAAPVLKHAIEVAKTDCRDYSDDYRVPRTVLDPKTIHNANKWTLLHVAAAFNHLQCAEMLVKSGGRQALRHTSNNGSTPLHLAAMNGHEAMVILLNESGASLKSINAHGRTPLLEAARFKHQVVIDYLRDVAAGRKAARDEQRRKERAAKQDLDGDGDEVSDEEDADKEKAPMPAPPAVGDEKESATRFPPI